MNDQQIKARCEQVARRVKVRILDDELPDYIEAKCAEEIESLYREAMAKGLEMAAVEAGNRDFGDGDDFQMWCREQANKLKEPQ